MNDLPAPTFDGSDESFSNSEILDVPDAEVPRIEPDPEVLDLLAPRNEMVPVVGIGGSAGSLEALQEFFSHVQLPSGFGYVVVVHLSPEHESAMAEILQRCTAMPVAQVNDPVSIEADHVYVIPPGKHLSMTGGTLEPSDMIRAKGRHVAVDIFFRTLAETHGTKSTAIVLSGGDGDGAIGLKRIKELGGLTLCQDPDEAQHVGMPREAIATGMVDWVLPVAEMPARLVEFRERSERVALPPENGSDEIQQPEKPGHQNETELRSVLSYLEKRAGHDFGYYKRATVLRRIARRMQVNGMDDLTSYLKFLKTHPGETGALLQDLLISVTNFFRDKHAFVTLQGIIPDLFRDKGPGDQVRVWVPACATGEEAYSIAILLCEYAATQRNAPSIQVFATDLDQGAIAIAREGRYPAAIVADVSEDHLSQFFAKEGGGYRIARKVRETVLFAHHDLLRDSPFSRLDLISCRNLLIYLNRGAQARAFDIFHFALRPAGYLFLGASESAEEASGSFAPVDKKQRLYSRRPTPRVGLSVPMGAPTLSFSYQSKPKSALLAGAGGYRSESPPAVPADAPNRGSWRELHAKFIEDLASPSLLVNRDYEIVHISESAGRFLRLPEGEASVNLLRLAHPQLKTELRAALFRATQSRSEVRLTGIPIDVDGGREWVDVTVQLSDKVAPDFLLVAFHPREAPLSQSDDPSTEAPAAGPSDAELLRHLEEEADQLRAGWKETIEQYEASTEELKASNEELQAMNEELRSATEELETGREELQSINEEITTINQELKGKVEQLGLANSDLQNLMASTRIATIFLDRKLRINRFTPSSTGLFNFIMADIGRPLSDVTHRLHYPDIIADAENVLEHLSSVEREVRDADGHWFLARQLPYRTTEDQIAGVVLTCIDITERKRAEEAREWLSDIVESSNDAIYSFNMDGNIVSWNHGAEEIFGFTAGEIKDKNHALLAPPARQDEIRDMMERLRRGDSISEFDTVRLRKNGQLVDVSLSASVMINKGGEIVGATVIAQEITERKLAVEQLRRARDELEARVKERTAELNERANQLASMAVELTTTEQRERQRLASVLHDQLQQVLVSAKMMLEFNAGSGGTGERDRGLMGLIDEALDNSRSLTVELCPPGLAEGLGPALNWLCETWMKEKFGLQVKREIDQTIDAADDSMRNLIFLGVRELLFNVVKHSQALEAEVTLKAWGPDALELTVRDHGLGCEFSEHDKFSCSGLAALTQRLQLLGGSFEIQGKPGEGVQAVIRAPRAVVQA